MDKKCFKRVGKALLRAFYPNRCICCGRLIEGEGLCSGCDALLPRVPAHICVACGQPKSECECFRARPGLNGFTAPYFNSGRARTALYRVKFGGAKEGVAVFGRRMAERFTAIFPDVKIDAVCCVPDAHRSGRSRGYYTARVLAESVAENLGCPFCPNMLEQIKSSRPQHSLDFKERLINVKGIYRVSAPVSGKNILVVDDIKTSGATLNECGRMLRKSRARNVFGLTAVMGRNLQYF